MEEICALEGEEMKKENKTAFTIIKDGFEETNRLKELQRQLNRKLKNIEQIFAN